MQSHCQHNLYICHCSPSSQDPSPIHPLASNGGGNTSAANHLQTTTLHRFPVKRNGNGNVVHESGNGQLKARPVYVSHSSVAVMTSPTLHITTTTSGNGGVAGTMPKKVPPPNVDLFATSTSKKGTHSVDLLNMQEASISPSTASSCSSLQNGVVVSIIFFLNMHFHKNSSHIATHSTSKTEKQTFEAKTASTFYMVVSNKALIPYNMHT